MKKIVFVAGLALAVVSFFAFNLFRQAPEQHALGPLPQSIKIARVPKADYREQLLKLIVKAEAESDSDILGKAQVVPDSSRNAVHILSLPRSDVRHAD